MLRRMPFLKLLAVAQTVLLARRHLLQLSGDDRRRLRELVMRGKGMNAAERDELRRLLSKLEPTAFAFATADAFSPLPIPGRRWRRRRRR
jgi:hypothetical protein